MVIAQRYVRAHEAGPEVGRLGLPPLPFLLPKGEPSSSPCGFLRMVGVDRINIPWELGISLGRPSAD